MAGTKAPRARLGAGEARRVALAASGFGGSRDDAPDFRRVDRATARLGLIQIDSVSVLARAHTVPLFSRLGPYDPALLQRLAYGGRQRRLFEYWGHEASLVRVDLQPSLRWRMERAREGRGIYGGLARIRAERPDFVDAMLRAVETRGPLASRDLAEIGGRGAGSWWGWSDGKRALEWLFWAGLLATADRRGFERVYDLTERVLPRAVLAVPTPSPDEAHRTLVLTAIRALGVATEPDLRDYFRLDPADAKRAVGELAEGGAIVPVAVEGWDAPAWLDPDARVPRRIEGGALLSPFDPLVWSRARTERLFGFRYRLEIYTPAHKREHGYYVLPFLLDGRIAARTDLKADRAGGRLIVLSVHVEPGHAPGPVQEALDAELATLARWLGLARIERQDG